MNIKIIACILIRQAMHYKTKDMNMNNQVMNNQNKS